MTELLIRDAAYSDLEAIWLRGAERWGIEHSVAYETGLFDLFDLLAVNPQMAPPRDRKTPPLRAHPYSAHIVLYRELPDAKGIEILRIVHGHADLRRLS